MVYAPGIIQTFFFLRSFEYVSRAWQVWMNIKTTCVCGEFLFNFFFLILLFFIGVFITTSTEKNNNIKTSTKSIDYRSRIGSWKEKKKIKDLFFFSLSSRLQRVDCRWSIPLIDLFFARSMCLFLRLLYCIVIHIVQIIILEILWLKDLELWSRCTRWVLGQFHYTFFQYSLEIDRVYTENIFKLKNESI